MNGSDLATFSPSQFRRARLRSLTSTPTRTSSTVAFVATPGLTIAASDSPIPSSMSWRGGADLAEDRLAVPFHGQVTEGQDADRVVIVVKHGDTADRAFPHDLHCFIQIVVRGKGHEAPRADVAQGRA